MVTDKEFPQSEKKEIFFRIQRFDPEKAAAPHFQEYKVPVVTGMTILEALYYIKEHLDGSLAFRCSCRMGICGSCGMYINSFPRLACHTQVFHLDAAIVEIKPLPNYDIIRDLIPDLTPLFQKHTSIKPYIINDDSNELDNASGEYLQSNEELEEYLQFAYCLKCGLCMSACPTVATDPKFLGPQPLGQVYRYLADNRDCSADRVDLVDSAQGVWRCHMAGACSEACPKGVDPALGAQLLKRKIVFGNKKKAAKLVGSQENAARKEGIPEAPMRTV